ncbi:MAG: hypothetical protein CVU54_17065 [Deltaproteobacteria bacterium HGW-Deltaproteobacteria-12]|nr:MAG: hypothetical protein CVU54_17065 [Deltaproteobacteria bacterium HGW-Deltaproteobacteria-12]
MAGIARRSKGAPQYSGALFIGQVADNYFFAAFLTAFFFAAGFAAVFFLATGFFAAFLLTTGFAFFTAAFFLGAAAATACFFGATGPLFTMGSSQQITSATAQPQSSSTITVSPHTSQFNVSPVFNLDISYPPRSELI